MGNVRYWGYSVSWSMISLMVLTSPVFAEVIELNTDKNSYFFNDAITFQGKVNLGDSGLVTIVIRDNNDDFVLLAHAITESDYSFKKTIEVNDKFKNIGIYNATGFILNMTAGTTTEFEVKNEMLLDLENTQEALHESKAYEVEQSEPKNQSTSQIIPSKKQIGFVDPQKDPKYYVERYYNEPEYKSWFDRNYPKYTIEEAVGYNEQLIYENNADFNSNKQVIPKAEAISISENNNTEPTDNELPQFILAIAGLAILFGATYGVKRKADHNSKQISINRETIRKKIINPIIGSGPLDILKTRLAKGEITLNEYNKLKRKLES